MKIKQQFSRRDFIKLSSIASASLPIALSGYPIYASEISSEYSFSEDNENIIVLIRLHGGNDGLNTFFNLNQYSNLQHVRSNLIMPKNKLVRLNNKTDDCLHPCLKGDSKNMGLKEVWDMEKLSVIQSVGYPHPNGSHFRSGDIWTSGSSHNEVVTTGWLGRYMGINHPKYPTNYPSSDYPHPFALTIGKVVTQTCQGPITNFGVVSYDPEHPSEIDILGERASKDCFSSKTDFVSSIMSQTNSYTKVIKEAYEKGKNLHDYGRTNNNKSKGKLKTIARLISGGLKTKVFTIGVPGWDHHAGQVDSRDRTQGAHAGRLKEISDAIGAFQDDLNLLKIDKKVIGVCFSEFGRRIKSNKSLGTDHGAAGPVIVFGSCAKNGFIGATPEIDRTVGKRDNLEYKIDFRSIYSSLLQNWLGVTKTDTESILFRDFKTLPIFKSGCSAKVGASDEIKDEPTLIVYPTPATNYVNVKLSVLNEETVNITLYNVTGAVIKIHKNIKFSVSNDTYKLNITGVANGVYFVHLLSGTVNYTEKIIVQ